MEEEENPLVCIICCKSFCPNGDELSRIRLHKHLKQFCEQIDEASKSSKSFKGTDQCCVLLGKTFHMMKRQDSVSMCSECLEYLTSAAVARTEAVPIETEVITLQAQLLEALKDLQTKMGTYYEKIRRIGEIVRNSDATKITQVGGEGETQKTRACRKRKATKEPKNDVLLLRNAIVNVSSDLKVYLEDLEKKSTLANSCITNTRSAKATPSQNPNESPESFGDSYPAVVTKTEIQQEDDLVSLVQTFPVKVEPDVDTMNDFSDNETDIHFEPVDYNEAIASEDELSLPDNSGDQGNDSDSDYNPPSSPELPPKRKKGDKVKFKVTSKPTDPKPRRKRLKPIDINLDGLTNFRKRLVRRILKKERYNKKRDDSDETESEKFHLKLVKDYPMEYDMEKGLVVVGGISANVYDDLESLECTLCGYQCRPQGQTAKRETYMDRAIWNHILGKHLKAFKCPQCARLVMSRTHLLKHMKDHEAESLNCDICGKPMASLQTLAGHKWTHMNQEEKNEWERQGRKRPFYKPEGEFQCAICGKEFKRRDSHEKHLITHVEDREKVVCPKCGKSLYRTSLYTYHQKYACPGNDKKPLRISCELCDVTFKTSIQKRKHMARMHDPAAALRPVSCPQCEKTFKTTDCLRHHLRTHTNETPFACSKCGSAFKQRRYLKRHFKSCQAVKRETF